MKRQRNRAVELIRSLLQAGPHRSADIRTEAMAQHIGSRTLGLAATQLGISVSNGSVYKLKDGWYWQLPEQGK